MRPPTRRIDPAWLTGDVMDRFWRNVVASPDGCFIWCATGDGPYGYGMFYLSGGMYLAHRVAATAAFGELNTELVIDHKCRNRRCVRAEHLREVTGQENWACGQAPSAITRFRTHCRHGHLLTPDNIVSAYMKKRVRVCKTCHYARVQSWFLRNRERVRQWKHEYDVALTQRKAVKIHATTDRNTDSTSAGVRGV